MNKANELADLLNAATLYTNDGDVSSIPERASDELRRLDALNAQMLEALKACQNYVATQAVGCYGDKCREPWCYSCSGDDEAGAEARKGMLAYQLVCAAIAAATEASSS